MNARDLYCKACGLTAARCRCHVAQQQDTDTLVRNWANERIAGANAKQVGGEHYDKTGEQHWDRIYRLYGRGYFIGCATKYAERYHLKNGKQDLEKSIHFLQKLIELEYPEPLVVDGGATSGYVNQDR